MDTTVTKQYRIHKNIKRCLVWQTKSKINNIIEKLVKIYQRHVSVKKKKKETRTGNKTSPQPEYYITSISFVRKKSFLCPQCSQSCYKCTGHTWPGQTWQCPLWYMKTSNQEKYREYLSVYRPCVRRCEGDIWQKHTHTQTHRTRLATH